MTMERDRATGRACRTGAVAGLLLRPAEPGDVPTVLDLITGLAEYEHLAEEMVATETDLVEALFGPEPVVEVTLAELDGISAGFALYFYNFSTFLGKRGIYLEDLFVRPAHRGKGVGKALLVYLANLARERDCGRLEWSVLDWNEPAIGFYRSLGAVAMDEWTVNRVSGEALAALGGTFSFEPAPGRGDGAGPADGRSR